MIYIPVYKEDTAITKDIKNRRSKRLPFRKRIRYGEDKPVYTGHTLNLSRHGTVVESARIFPRGTKLNIEIIDNVNSSGENPEPIHLTGTVRWISRSLGITQRGKMGIEFTSSVEIEKLYQSRVRN